MLCTKKYKKIYSSEERLGQIAEEETGTRTSLGVPGVLLTYRTESVGIKVQTDGFLFCRLIKA